MDLKWSLMSKDVAAAQHALEGLAGEAAVAAADAECAAAGPAASAGACFERTLGRHAEYVAAAWWKLADILIFKFADGFVNDGVLTPPTGYPAWWLKAVAYADGPPPVPPGARGVSHTGERALEPASSPRGGRRSGPGLSEA